jgi:uracil-DNA glycosylase
MTTCEYFGDWMKVLPKDELPNVIYYVNYNYSHGLCTPEYKNIFKAFELCSFGECRVVMLGQDPYPQEGVATGVLFGNKKDTKVVSPSLRVVMDSLDSEGKCFDITMEHWARQGILMINSSLTCKVNRIGSDFSIWRPFISKFLINLSAVREDIVYALFGRQAQSFGPCISSGIVLEEKHPAFYARYNASMPDRIFNEINLHLEKPIQWCTNNNKNDQVLS